MRGRERWGRLKKIEGDLRSFKLKDSGEWDDEINEMGRRL